MVNASNVGKGKGGAVGAVTGKNGKGQAQITEYIASFILGFCQGPVGGFGQGWYDKYITDAKTGLGGFYSVNYGADGQDPDPYWVSNHPSKAIGYSGTVNFAFANKNLGPSTTLPNFSVEIFALLNSAPNGYDADPSLIIQDFLTNPRYGAGFPLANFWSTNTDMTNPTSYASYVNALGIYLSYSMETQQEAQQYLKTITDLTNSAVVWSGGLLKIIPYGDTQVIGSITSNSSWTITLAGGDASGSDEVIVTISDPVFGTQQAGTTTISGEHLPDIANNLVDSLTGIISAFNIIITNVSSAQTPPAGPPPDPQNNTAIVVIEMIQSPPSGTTTMSISGPSIDFNASLSTLTSGGIGTYTPNNVPIYSLGEDDYIVQETSVGTFLGPNPGGDSLRTGATPLTGQFTDDPLHISRSSPADAYNYIRIECLDRAAWYNSSIVEVSDQAAVDAYGVREQGSINARAICDPGYVGYTVAQLMLQRAQMFRNTYSFQLGWKYILLEPMDLVQITDPRLGAQAITVRITQVQEDDEGLLAITAEDYFGAYSPTVQYPPAIPPSETPIWLPNPNPTILGAEAGTVMPRSPQLNSSTPPNFATTPGNVNTPIIFEPPPALVTSSPGYEIWIALSGPPGWGGAQVLVSTDASSYAPMGTIMGASVMGVTTANFPTYSGPDPDTTSTLSVDLTESSGTLTSAMTDLNASQGATLCWVGGIAMPDGITPDSDGDDPITEITGGNGEMLSYVNATTTALNKYNLTRLYRGQFGTIPRGFSIPPVRQFTAIGPNVARISYPANFVNVPLFFKFPSVNETGGGLQDYSVKGFPVYTFTPSGSSHAVPTTVSGSFSGMPSGSPSPATFVYGFSTNTFFPQNFQGSQGVASAAAMAMTTFMITWTHTSMSGPITTNIGTMIFAAGAKTATFSAPFATWEGSFAPGDVLTIVAPSMQDATLANVSWTLSGVQTPS